MKCDVVIIVGLFVVAGSGCGREASERFNPNKFVQAKEPAESGPLRVSAPTHAAESSSSSSGSSGSIDFRQATAAHGPSIGVRAQMLEIKQANATANVLEDVKTALQEGTSSELVTLPTEGARVFSDWVSSLQSEIYHLSRLSLSRDAQFDRVEKVGENAREKIRRYEISFGGPEYVGWIEVKRSGKRWIIVDAGSYTLMHDPVEDDGPSTDWLNK